MIVKINIDVKIVLFQAFLQISLVSIVFYQLISFIMLST